MYCCILHIIDQQGQGTNGAFSRSVWAYLLPFQHGQSFQKAFDPSNSQERSLSLPCFMSAVQAALAPRQVSNFGNIFDENPTHGKQM